MTWVLASMGLWLHAFGNDRVACELARTEYHQQTGSWAYCSEEVVAPHVRTRAHHHSFDESVTYCHRHTHIED